MPINSAEFLRYFQTAGQRILRLHEVKQRTGLSRSSVYSFMSDGAFPASVKLGPRAVGWIASEVDAWIAQRVKQRVAAGALLERAPAPRDRAAIGVIS